VGIYVDDLVIIGTEEAEVEAFKAQMKATFPMNDLGLLCFYSGGITLRQAHYAKHIVELGGMGDCNPAHTPMEEWLKLSCPHVLSVACATWFIPDRTWRSLSSM
jgi:hypothetical protein